MPKPYTFRFGPWTPDLQDVGVEMPYQWSDTELAVADCENVYWQDAAYRSMPGLESIGPSLGTPILDCFTWYDNTEQKEAVFAATANGLFILVDGVWTALSTETDETAGGLAITIGLGSPVGLATAMSPTSASASSTATSYGFNLSAISGYGSPTYNWRFGSATGPGSWSVPSGQGTANAVPTITGAVAGNTSTVTCYCDIVLAGTTYTVSAPLSYACQSSFSPSTNTYTSGSGFDTAPVGASQVTIEVWGGGASGGAGDVTSGDKGGGGGAAGYSRSVYSVSGGQTIAYSVGSPANSSTVSSGSLGITTMTSNSGTQGQAWNAGAGGGNGGSASGGNQANVTGGAGGAASGGTGGFGGNTTAGIYANTGPSNGDGGSGSRNATINQGVGGMVSFHYS